MPLTNGGNEERMKKIEDESRRIGGASVKTTAAARQFADIIAGLYGLTIGAAVERAIVHYAEHLAESKDARGVALAAYLKAGGPTVADDATAKAGTLGKPSDDAKAAAAKRDAKRSKR